MTAVRFFEPISWETRASNLEKAVAEDGWEKVARWSEGFWAHLSCCTDVVCVIEKLPKREFSVERGTRKLEKAHYAWMLLEIGICLLVVPLLIMLAAKLWVRSYYTFSPVETTPSLRAAPVPTSASSPMIDTTLVSPVQAPSSLKVIPPLSSVEASSASISIPPPTLEQLFEMIHKPQDRALFFVKMIEGLPEDCLPILRTVNEKGLTLLHYAYLYHDEAAQKCLEGRDKELSTICSTKKVHARPVYTSEIGKSPAELGKYFDQLAASYALRFYIQRQTGQPPDSPYWPWQGRIPSIEEALSFLDSESINRKYDGKTLLHLAKYYRHLEIETQLIAKHADPAIKSDYEIDDRSLFPWLNTFSSGSIFVERGLTADEMSREFWDQLYWHVALTHIVGEKITDYRGKTRIQFPGWGDQEGLDFQEVLSHITSLNRRDKIGLTLMHYAVLFDQQKMEEQLRAMDARLDEATQIDWMRGRPCLIDTVEGSFTPSELLEYLVDNFIVDSMEYGTEKSSKDRLICRPPGVHRLCDMERRTEEAITRCAYKRLLDAGAFKEDGAKSMQELFEGLKIKDTLRYFSEKRVKAQSVLLRGVFMNSYSGLYQRVEPYTLPNQLLDMGLDPIERDGLWDKRYFTGKKYIEEDGEKWYLPKKLDPEGEYNIRWPIENLFQKSSFNAADENERQQLKKRVLQVIREPITSAVVELPPVVAGIVAEYLSWEPVTNSHMNRDVSNGASAV